MCSPLPFLPSSLTFWTTRRSLSRISSWLKLFKKFLLEFEECHGSDKIRRATVANLDVCLEFLAEVAGQHKGRTRVVAAARALDFVRAVFGWSLLKGDPRTALLKRGALRLQPHKPRGASPFPAVAMAAIASKWGRSSTWWKRMVATIVVIAFVDLLRGAGILSIPRKGVTWVVHHREYLNPPFVPANHTGALLLIPFRKSSQSQPEWVPIKRGLATSLLSRYMRWRRRHARSNSFYPPTTWFCCDPPSLQKGMFTHADVFNLSPRPPLPFTHIRTLTLTVDHIPPPS